MSLLAGLKKLPWLNEVRRFFNRFLAKNFEKVAQENRWKYLQQIKHSDSNNKKNMVKQILPDFGQETIIKNLKELKFSRALDEKNTFNVQFLLDSVNNLIHKMFEKFKEDWANLIIPCGKGENDSTDEKIAEKEEILQNYNQKIQNLKAMFEVELQNKFIKAQVSNSNAEKFEKQLQRQLAMKLSREEKLSLAVYQERYIQEFIKERYQVLTANNETLQQSLLGHDFSE